MMTLHMCGLASYGHMSMMKFNQLLEPKLRLS